MFQLQEELIALEDTIRIIVGLDKAYISILKMTYVAQQNITMLHYAVSFFTTAIAKSTTNEDVYVNVSTALTVAVKQQTFDHILQAEFADLGIGWFSNFTTITDAFFLSPTPLVEFERSSFPSSYPSHQPLAAPSQSPTSFPTSSPSFTVISQWYEALRIEFESVVQLSFSSAAVSNQIVTSTYVEFQFEGETLYGGNEQ